MKKLVTNIVLISLLVIVIVPQTGCKGETEETEPVPSESNRWLESLNVIPENEVTVKGVYIQNLDYLKECQENNPQVTEQYAVVRLSVASGSGLFRHYFNLTDPEADVEGEYRNSLGFTFDNVGQMIDSGQDPHVYQAYRGDFDKNSIDNAVKTGPLNELLEIVPYGDFSYYRWGEDDNFDLERRSNVRPLGRGHRLALADDFVFWTVWDAGIEDMIDSYSGNTGSLADIEEYKLLAEGLSKFRVFSAYFTGDTNSYSELKAYLEQYKDFLPFRPGQQERLDEAIEDVPLLKPYLAYATGAGLDKNGYYLVVVLVNPDNNTAATNASLMKERINKTENVWQGKSWLEWITDTQIENEGRLTIAKLYGPACEFWPDRFRNLNLSAGGTFEPLVLHE